MTLAAETAGGLGPLQADLRAFARSRFAPIVAGGVAASAVLVAVIGPAFQTASPPAPAALAAVAAVASTVKPYVTAKALAGAPETAADAENRVVLQDLLGKAGLRPHFDIGRLTWDQARKLNALNLAIPQAPDVAKPFILALDTKDGRQALNCLTQAAYYEAGAAGADSEAAVVQVVLNRLRHPDFPKSVCGVVYQGSARQTGCQFTFTCDGALGREVDLAAWRAAETVARRALGGYVVPAVGAATYYHADYVFPAWAPTLVKMVTVGPHIFYRMTGAEGRAAFLTGRYAGGEDKLSKAILYAVDRLTQGGQGAGLPPAEDVKEAAPGSVQLAKAPAPAVVEAPKIVVAEAEAPSIGMAPAKPAISAEAPQLTLAAKPESYFADPNLTRRRRMPGQ